MFFSLEFQKKKNILKIPYLKKIQKYIFNYLHIIKLLNFSYIFYTQSVFLPHS